MRTLRWLALATAGFAYAVIVIGFVVRITNSGMGCGPDWPLCNGRIVPAFTSAEVFIEWTHRVAVLALSGLTIAVVAVAWSCRKAAGGRGHKGTLRPAEAALFLLIVQSGLGRQAVKAELEAPIVVTHLGLALALLAVLLVIGLRAGLHTGQINLPTVRPDQLSKRGAMAGLVLSAFVIVLGGMTAMTGAAPACQGFPLCSGQLWPTASESGLAHIHWTHRLLAYGLFFHLLGLAVAARRRGIPAPFSTATFVAFGLGILQVTVGALMVLTLLPTSWRVLHAVIGSAVWVALVYLVWVIRSAGDINSAE